MKFAVSGFKAIEKMHLLERVGHVLPAAVEVGLRVPRAGALQCLIHDLPRAHLKAAMRCAKAALELADDEMVFTRFARCIDELSRDLKRGVPGGCVKIIELQKARSRQHDVGKRGRLGDELFVHAEEQIFAREALVHLVKIRADHRRVGVLHQHRRHW